MERIHTYIHTYIHTRTWHKANFLNAIAGGTHIHHLALKGRIKLVYFKIYR